MRAVTFFFALVLLGAAVPAGCESGRVELGPINTVEAGELILSVELPKRDFVVGEQFTVTVTARNAGREPIEIVARSGAPVRWRARSTAVSAPIVVTDHGKRGTARANLKSRPPVAANTGFVNYATTTVNREEYTQNYKKNTRI